MEIEEVFKSPFKSPFKLVFSCPPYNSPVLLPGIKFIYRTEEIAGPTTTEKNYKFIQRVFKTNHRKI